MEEESVMYCGRIVPKKGFRTFVYDLNNEKKLVESWDEYQQHMETGLWFPYPKNNEKFEEHFDKSRKKGKK